jgi:hypothetical protein
MCQKLSQLHKTENLYKTFVQSRLKSKYLNLLINQSAASHKLRYLQLKFCAPLALIFFRQLKLMRKHSHRHLYRFPAQEKTSPSHASRVSLHQVSQV